MLSKIVQQSKQICSFGLSTTKRGRRPEKPQTQQTFDQKMKEKYKKQEETEVESEEDPIDNKKYIKEMGHELDNSSVLQRFRRAVFEKNQVDQQELEMHKSLHEYNKKLKAIMNTGSKQEQLSKIRKLAEKFMNSRDVINHKTNNLDLSDYGDYTAYKTNKVKIVDRKLEQGENLRGKFLHKNYKFINDLGPQYKQYVEMQQAIEQLGEGATAQNLIMSEENERFYFAQSIDRDERFHIRAIDIPYEEDDKDGPFDADEIPTANDDLIARKLSPEATFRIYSLYCEGWSIRDICHRYGIMPARAKFIIWSKAQFFTEILPRMGFKHFLDCLDWETQYGDEYGFIDYGLDIQELYDDQTFLTKITCWNNDMVDITKERDLARNDRLDYLAEKVNKRIDITKKYAKLDVGTIGTKGRMYFLRDWKIFRGKGSDFYHLSRNTPFKRLYKNKGRHVYY